MFSSFLPNRSDQQLVQRISQRTNDSYAAENELFKLYSYFIEKGMQKYGLSEDEAFSAYSDAVLTLIDHIRNGTFQGRSSIKTYIFQIFSNKCVDTLRKNSTKKSSMNQGIDIEDVSHILTDHEKTALEQLVADCDLDKLHRSLKKIGQKCQEILALWSENMPDKEIAITLGYNTAAVAKTTRMRCLGKLREAYLDVL